jgi:hypothetical protein
MRESPLARNQAGALGLRHTHPRVIGILLIAPDARDRNYFDSQSHKSRPCPSLKSPEPDPQNVLLLDENESLEILQCGMGRARYAGSSLARARSNMTLTGGRV